LLQGHPSCSVTVPPTEARGQQQSFGSTGPEDELDLGVDLSELDDLEGLAPPVLTAEAALEVRSPLYFHKCCCTWVSEAALGDRNPM
jgi:hypothetical protein